MKSFREEYRKFIYLVNMSGLYMTSIEKISKKKFLFWCLTFWTKIALVSLPVQFVSVIPYFLYDDDPRIKKLSIFRKTMILILFEIKIIFFYWKRKDIENLIDLWDSSFKEPFYVEHREVGRIHLMCD
ncbi:hypothetical protein RUM44_013125 [Polyplax serrata]|uniref:Uncharacterized protein n=1 Tax=Polyplax serrata TaxID=468196 RepID=A0ABR1BGY4_POLSC